MADLPHRYTLPDTPGPTVEPPSHPASAGNILGVDYSAQGLSEQQMIAKLNAYVTAHNGALLGVQFDPSDTTKGFFIVLDLTTSVASRYDFSINTRTNVVTVIGPQPWQV
jgi:glucan biosynthesis protein